MTPAGTIVVCILFWWAVRRASIYCYGQDVASTLAHIPIFIPGGYRYFYRAAMKWLGWRS